MMKCRLLPVLFSAVPALTQTAFAQPANSNRAPSASEQSAAIAAIREYAVHHIQGLPDYTCTETIRWTTTPPPVNPNAPILQNTGVVEEQIGFLDHREMQKITAVNGKPPATAEPQDLPETLSRGEFGSLLALIFDPQTPTEFHWDRWGTRDGRRMYVFSYRVPKAKGYVVQEGKRKTVVAFKGLVYADAETKAVMRIEMQCIDFPGGTSYQSLSLKLNYKLTKVAEQEFVVPSDFVMNSRQGSGETEADAAYKDYRRFDADATIQFGGADAGR